MRFRTLVAAGLVVTGLAPVGAAAQNSCTIRGTSGDDVLIGTSGPDVICAGAGDDRVEGRGGDDVIYGGDGDDVLVGESGDDRIFGGPGADHLEGTLGDDVLGGGPGDDTLLGAQGEDRLWGDLGDDLIEGGRDRDEANGGEGDDIVRGGETISGRYRPTDDGDVLGGGPGVDLLIGTNGDDVLMVGTDGGRAEGLDGDDRLHEAPDGANAELIGGDGDDRIVAAGPAELRPMPEVANPVAAPAPRDPAPVPAPAPAPDPAPAPVPDPEPPAAPDPAPAPVPQPVGEVYRIPNDRSIDWSTAGRPTPIPNAGASTSVLDHGAQPGDGRDDTAAFRSAIDSVRGRGGVVSIPAGTYDLSGQIQLSDDVVLRGVGASRTTLRFNGGVDTAIAIGENVNAGNGWRALPSDAARGTTTIRVADPDRFRVGGFAELDMRNLWEAAPGNNGWSQPPDPNAETWRTRTRGQLVRVVGVDNGAIRIATGLNLAFATADGARIRPIDLTRNAGVERLSIRMPDGSVGYGIRLQHTADSWITDVDMSGARRAQVEVFVSLGCELRGNHLHNASAAGNGGQGYGFSIQRHSTGCLVENNVISGMRHATLLHVGATGNVYAYNHSTDSVHPEGDRADLSFHGHHANHNLVEGNVVQQINIADWWGRVGPGNTIFRNCIRPVRGNDSGSLRISYDSDRQNVVGNIFVRTGSRLLIDAGVDGTLNHRNWIGGAWTRSGQAPTDLPASLYLDGSPGFSGPWPVADNGAASCTNGAAQRGARVANP